MAKANQLASMFIEQYAEVEKDEGAIVSRLLKMIPDGSDIFVSSSMPVRDIDTFYWLPRKIYVFCQSRNERDRWCRINSNRFQSRK